MERGWNGVFRSLRGRWPRLVSLILGFSPLTVWAGMERVKSTSLKCAYV